MSLEIVSARGGRPPLTHEATAPLKATAPQAKKSTQTVTIKLFNEGIDNPLRNYTFQPDTHSAKFDVPLVQQLATLVEQRFDKQGCPPHWQPAAYEKVYTGQSDIFSVDHKEWDAMSDMEMHTIHRDHHILVTGVDIGKPINFDVVGLAMVTDIVTHIVEIQYSGKKSEFNSDAMLEKGTLRGLLTHDRPESGVAKNMLDLPLGHSTVQIPPRFTDILSDTWTWNSVEHLLTLQDMWDVMSWGTVQCSGKCFMCGCTTHFMLSTEGTITLGHHYILVSMIRRTCYGLVHTFVMGVGITNTSHDVATCCMLRQLMAFWYCHLILGNNFGGWPSGHDRFPSSDSVASDLEQENLAGTWFRVMMKTFTSRFFTVIEGTIIHTSYIWESILVGFATAVVRYMESKQKVVQQVHTRGPKEVATALSLHLELDHLHGTSRPIQIDCRDWVSNQSEALGISPKKDIRISI
ncbi:hypothetical protein FIBSPDRAFT_887999 [Athelia psychrophila]|uniref:Uncharacterized protein n=1 Tax=Athelia psychrophila TaxID=1759441 RepID=A0A166NXM1_9AGAM|nr:hypothetical protein FIBSPDRAFT_887999 [Fibularhizoctonia sp. CBS 109695]